MERFQEGKDSGTSPDGGLIVYFSSVSEMTKRFVDKTGIRSMRIPVRRQEEFLKVDEPYVLLTPSYGAGNGSNAVPKQVIKFLNDPENRKHIVAVAGSGSRNYGDKYCLAARIVAQKCQVPLIYTFELLGLPEDVSTFTEIFNTTMERV